MEPPDDACSSVTGEFGMAQKAAGSVVAGGVWPARCWGRGGIRSLRKPAICLRVAWSFPAKVNRPVFIGHPRSLGRPA
jgi:hypothetical protein